MSVPYWLSYIIEEDIHSNNGLLLEINHNELAEFYAIVGSDVNLEDFRLEIQKLFSKLMSDFWTVLVMRFVSSLFEYWFVDRRNINREELKIQLNNKFDDEFIDRLMFYVRHYPKNDEDNKAFATQIAKFYTVDDLLKITEYNQTSPTLTCNKTWKGLLDIYNKYYQVTNLSLMIEAIDVIIGLSHHSGQLLEYLADSHEDISNLEKLINAKFNGKNLSYFFKDIPEKTRILVNKKRRDLGLPLIIQQDKVPSNLYTTNRHEIARGIKQSTLILAYNNFHFNKETNEWVRTNPNPHAEGEFYDELISITPTQDYIKVWHMPYPDPQFETNKKFYVNEFSDLYNYLNEICQ